MIFTSQMQEWHVARSLATATGLVLAVLFVAEPASAMKLETIERSLPQPKSPKVRADSVPGHPGERISPKKPEIRFFNGPPVPIYKTSE
jgi:hypothetical protein